jgi:hypothetical protein
MTAPIRVRPEESVPGLSGEPSPASTTRSCSAHASPQGLAAGRLEGPLALQVGADELGRGYGPAGPAGLGLGEHQARADWLHSAPDVGHGVAGVEVGPSRRGAFRSPPPKAMGEFQSDPPAAPTIRLNRAASTGGESDSSSLGSFG